MVWYLVKHKENLPFTLPSLIEISVHVVVSRDSSVGIALDYGLDDRGSRVRFSVGAGNFSFTTASRTALGPTQPPIKLVRGALSVGVERSCRKADHSHPSSAEVKERVELYLHSPNKPSWRGVQLKHRDNFTNCCTADNKNDLQRQVFQLNEIASTV
jgi:hypothetical protein